MNFCESDVIRFRSISGHAVFPFLDFVACGRLSHSFFCLGSFIVLSGVPYVNFKLCCSVERLEMAQLVRGPVKQVVEPLYSWRTSFEVPEVEDWEDEVPKPYQFRIPCAEKLAELKKQLRERKARAVCEPAECPVVDQGPPGLEPLDDSLGVYEDAGEIDEEEFVPGKIVTPEEIAVAMMQRVPGSFDGMPCKDYDDYLEQFEFITSQQKFLMHKTVEEPEIENFAIRFARLEISSDTSIPLWRRMGFVQSSVVWATAEAQEIQQRIVARYIAYQETHPTIKNVSKFAFRPVPAFPKPGPKCVHDPYDILPVCSGTEREPVTYVREPGRTVPILKTFDDVRYSKHLSVKRLEQTTTIEKLVQARKERSNLHVGRVQVDQTRQVLSLSFDFCATPEDAVKDNGVIDTQYASDLYLSDSFNYNLFCWAGMKYHPLRLPGMPADVSYLSWEHWPYYLIRNHVLPKNAQGKIHYFPYKLYHFARTEFCNQDVVCLNVLNMDVHKIVHVIVPRECGVQSDFHKTVEIQKPDVFLLAHHFGLNVNRVVGITKGLDMFLKGVVFGRHSICELYVGNCPKCDIVLCHLDATHSCIQCYTCKKYFSSIKYLKFHKENCH